MKGRVLVDHIEEVLAYQDLTFDPTAVVAISKLSILDPESNQEVQHIGLGLGGSIITLQWDEYIYDTLELYLSTKDELIGIL